MIFQAGSLAMLIGGIFFGQGWCSKDNERKARGIQTMIVGAVAATIGLVATAIFK